MKSERLPQWIAAGLLTLAALAAGLGVMWQVSQPRAPEAVAEAYFRAGYQRNYGQAWNFISTDDKAYKPKAQYLAENTSAAGLELDLLDRLAAWGEFKMISIVSGRDDHVIVTARARFPDLAQPEVAQLLQAAETTPQRDLLAQLESLYAAGQIQFVESDPTFSLAYQGGHWGVVLHWSGAVTVRLTAAVSPDLPWEFYPVQSEVQAVPGETVQVVYRVKNLADHSITGKARHVVEPQAYRSFFETIQCFCFTEQTLAAGEEKEMPLIFRVDFTVPPDVTEFSNGYTFYRLESFPEESFSTPVP
jgi:hypothetical protein